MTKYIDGIKETAVIILKHAGLSDDEKELIFPINAKKILRI